jgi:RNA polymerase sigma-70 factor, ECF subfamily
VKVELPGVWNEVETTLIKAARNGDLERFGELCRRYYPSLVGIAYTLLRDHHLAEDAAQESLARALTNLERLKSDGKVGMWLAAICRNVAKDMLTVKARPISSHRVAPAGEPTHCDDGQGRAVREAVMRLPASCREVIVLRYYAGLSHEQIGSLLGTSQMAVNGRLTRAKRKLRTLLRRDGLLED